MSYHFCCFETRNQDLCPIDFSQSGQEVLSVVWKMCNTENVYIYSYDLHVDLERDYPKLDLSSRSVNIIYVSF